MVAILSLPQCVGIFLCLAILPVFLLPHNLPSKYHVHIWHVNVAKHVNFKHDLRIWHIQSVVVIMWSKYVILYTALQWQEKHKSDIQLTKDTPSRIASLQMSYRMLIGRIWGTINHIIAASYCTLHKHKCPWWRNREKQKQNRLSP